MLHQSSSYYSNVGGMLHNLLLQLWDVHMQSCPLSYMQMFVSS